MILILYQTSNGFFDIFMHCEENTVTIIMDGCSQVNLNSNSTMCHGQNGRFVLYYSKFSFFFNLNVL